MVAEVDEARALESREDCLGSREAGLGVCGEEGGEVYELVVC